MAELQGLDVETARIVEQVCDAIVPGSARVQLTVYVGRGGGLSAVEEPADAGERIVHRS
jgi:hypothetical protein